MTTGRAPWTSDLHLRLSRRYALELRATRGAAAALVVSLVAWVLGLAPAAHAAAALVAAAAGALLPVRAPVERAFGWIAGHAGLAYQTHVEHAGRPDPFGLLAAAEVEARLSVRGVTPPPRSAWWLPMAAGALGVWLVASAVGGLLTLPGLGGAPSPAAAPGSPSSAPPPLVAPEDADPTGAEAEDDAPDAEEPTPPGPPQDPAQGGDDDPAGAGTGPEGDPLDRFLDNLRERPRDTAEGAALEPEGTPGRDGVRDDAEPTGELQERREEGDAAGELRPTDEQPGDEEGEDGAAPAPGEGEGEGEETVEIPANDGGDGDEGPDGPPGDGGDEEGPEPGTEPGGEEAPDGTPGEAPMEGDDAPFDAGDGDEAGIGAGRPDEGEGTPPGEPAGPEEALTGPLLAGEETPGGRVRLPGRDDAIVPEGVPVERYERAVEQAIVDGAVPVPYQEIIRNYFR